MTSKTLPDAEIVSIVTYTFIAFILMGLVLILFFYFSRKKINQNKMEKKDLEINHQKELLRAIILTQEDERKRIAQDLHDDISSKLNIISLNSHLLKTVNLSANELEEISNNIIDLTAKTLDSSKRIAHDLLPPVLDKFGLHAGIEELAVEFSSSKSVKIAYNNHLKFENLDAEKELHVFRILQELINNSIRHGKASNVTIVFKLIEGQNTCIYTDDGVGFDLANIANRKSLGMKNIESRVAFLGGSLTVKSVLNKGIKVIFNF